jgi:hypothetical protein
MAGTTMKYLMFAGCAAAVLAAIGLLAWTQKRDAGSHTVEPASSLASRGSTHPVRESGGQPGRARPPALAPPDPAMLEKAARARAKGRLSGELARAIVEGQGDSPISQEVLLRNLEQFEAQERETAEKAADAVGLTPAERQAARELLEEDLRERWDIRTQARPAGAASAAERVAEARAHASTRLRELLGQDRFIQYRRAQVEARRARGEVKADAASR